ncbi:MAG: response regulator [Deltaproteobacteria bacterium]|nr:response regulator [Deltaproteobacteria bacterium]
MESMIATMASKEHFMEKILRILILEDKVSDADLIEFELEEAGIPFTSRRAWTEQGYLQALEEFSPDLILSDYDLPQYSGALALDAVKRRSPEVPFILVTGAITEYDGLCGEIVSRGARECVLKNHLEQLAPAIRRAISIQ